MPKLSALQVRSEAVRRTEKTRTLSDGEGLNLVIPSATQTGNARWVLRFMHQGHEQLFVPNEN